MTRFAVYSLLCLAFAGGASAGVAAPFTLSAARPRVITPGELAAAEKTETPGRLSADQTTLTFCGKSVRLVAVTGPDNDMLSYRIHGRRNPALVVSVGATIKLLFVNTDDDMKHNVRFGPALKAYPNVMASYVQTSVGTPEIACKSGAAFSGEELTLHAPAVPGTFVYLCTVRGHAQGGMFGKIVVK